MSPKYESELRNRLDTIENELDKVREDLEYHSFYFRKEDLNKKLHELNEEKNSIHKILFNVKVLHSRNIDPNKVCPLAKVKFRRPDNDEEMVISIGDYGEYKSISTVSPFAQSLLNHRKGEEVEVQVPRGSIKVIITDIIYEESLLR